MCQFLSCKLFASIFRCLVLVLLSVPVCFFCWLIITLGVCVFGVIFDPSLDTRLVADCCIHFIYLPLGTASIGKWWSTSSTQGSLHALEESCSSLTVQHLVWGYGKLGLQ